MSSVDNDSPHTSHQSSPAVSVLFDGSLPPSDDSSCSSRNNTPAVAKGHEDQDISRPSCANSLSLPVLELEQTEGPIPPVGVYPQQPYPFLVPVYPQPVRLESYPGLGGPLPLEPNPDPEKESERLATNLFNLVGATFPHLQGQANRIVGYIIEKYDIPVLQVIAVTPQLFIKAVEDALLLQGIKEGNQAPSVGEHKEDGEDAVIEAEEADEIQVVSSSSEVTTSETKADFAGTNRARLPLFARGLADQAADSLQGKSPDLTSNSSLDSPGQTPSPLTASEAPSPSVSYEQTAPPPGFAQALQGSPLHRQASPGQQGQNLYPGVIPYPGLAQGQFSLIPVPFPGQLGFPILSGQLPPQPGQHPVQQAHLQAQAGQPLQPKQLPAQSSPSPVQPGQLPTQQAKTSTQPGQIPVHQGQIPAQQGQFPFQTGQFLVQPGQFQAQPVQFQFQPGQFPVPPGQNPFQPGQFSAQPGQFPAQPGQFPVQPGQYPPGQFSVQPGQIPLQPGQIPGQPPGFPWQPGLSLINPFAQQVRTYQQSNIQLASNQQQFQLLKFPPEVSQQQVPQTTLSDDSSDSDDSSEILDLQLKSIPVACPVSDNISRSENSTSSLKTVALSAPGLPVSLSGLPTAPPGRRVPWKPVSSKSDPNRSPTSKSTEFSDTKLFHQEYLASPSSSLIDAELGPPLLKQKDTDIKDIDTKAGEFSWSQVVRGSCADVPYDENQVKNNEQRGVGVSFYNQAESAFSSDLDLNFFAESSKGSTMSQQQRKRSKSPNWLSQEEVFAAFRGHLTEQESVVQINCMTILVPFHPTGCPVGKIWEEYKKQFKTRPKKKQFDNLGSSIDNIFKRFYEVIKVTDKNTYSLTARGVKYANWFELLPKEAADISLADEEGIMPDPGSFVEGSAGSPPIKSKTGASSVVGKDVTFGLTCSSTPQEFERGLTNPDLLSIVQHTVKALAAEYPQPQTNDQLNHAIRKSRGKGAVVEELGLQTVAACLRQCKDLVITADVPGEKKKMFVLTGRGVEYAKYLGYTVKEKQDTPSTRRNRQKKDVVPSPIGRTQQMRQTPFHLENDDFPALGAKPKKKEQPKLEFLGDSMLESLDRTSTRRIPPLMDQAPVYRSQFNSSKPLGASSSGLQMSDWPMPGEQSLPSAPPKANKYSQLKAEQTRSSSPASTSSHTPEPVERKKSDFTYNPEEFGTSSGNTSRSLMSTRLTKENLEAIAEECIDRLSNADVLVTPQSVERQILTYTGRGYWRDLGVHNVHRVEKLECVNQLQRMQGKVSTYIQTFVCVRSIATVHDLHRCMQEFITGEGTFDNLKLGPLAKQPLIREYFNLPPGAPILEISSPLVIQHLRDYVNENNLWTNPVDLKEFLEYLQEKYKTETPYELGVRLKSLPLAMQMLKKGQRDQAQTVRECVSHMKQLTEGEVKSGFDNFKTKFLLANTGGDGFTIRHYYLDLNPAEVVADIFGKYNVLLQFLMQYGANVKNRTLQKLHQVSQEFTKQVKADGLGRSLFQLSVCVGAQEMQETLQAVLEKMFPPPKPGGGGDADDNTGFGMSANPPPKLDDLVSKFGSYLEGCIRISGSLTLDYLMAIEKKLCEHFNHHFFNTMGQGSFLAFLLHQPSAKKVFEENGGNNLTAGGSQSDGKNSLYRPSQGDLVDLVHQCGIKEENVETTKQLEAAVCSHYKVAQVQSAGHGPIARIQAVLKKQKQTRDHNVVYEGALCLGSRYSEHSMLSAEKHAGILGAQTEEAALLHLEACPLLENLETWSQWSMVFQPQFGPLKTFIQKHGGIRTHRTTSGQTYSTTIQALETEPGVLLKITAKTGIDVFRVVALSGEVSSTCGHLVSLVVENKGLKSMSMELLANHMQSALFTLNSEAGSTEDEGGYNKSTTPKVVHFVKDCLCRLPIRMCEAVANQIFLEPLSNVLSGGTVSKKLILESCRTSEEKSRIYLLGMLLGIDTWSHCYQDSLHRAQQSMMSTRRERKKNGSFSDLLDDDVQSELDVDEEAESESEDEQPQWSDTDSDSYLSDVEQEVKKIVTIQNEPEVANEEDVVVEAMEDKDTASADTEVTEVIEDGADVTDENVPETGANDEAEALEKEEEEVIPPGEEHLTPKERECKKVVDLIRKEEFGIGIVLNEDAEKLMKVQQDRLGRSLDRLSRDLYSKDTHFVLELVQNADDNTYPSPDPTKSKRSSGPAIRFIVETDSVTVLNNECGFEESNIRALCDVGRSTKGKHKFGYIGQKGIGFKSVFRVTDKPEVHSNGYHICFDVESGPTGYILPHWIDDQTPETTNRWTTKIVLKLKDELDMSKGKQQTRTLANRFHDVRPSLLLFLHRLRCIVIENKVDNMTSKMTRRDIGENIIEIKHNTGTDRWLVTKKLLDASKISPKGKSGAEIESTEVALAFPLQGKDKGSLRHRPPQQPVFAFLPLRSYGFRFIVQGDFEVPSSREDVDSDSSWNQGLLDVIPQLFIEALDTFKMQPELSPLDAVNAYLQFVPMENETLDFFKSVASKIHQLLKSKPCLPTEPDAEGHIEWKLPSQMVICQDPLVQQVISQEMLEKHIGLFYLHSAVMSASNTPLLQSLGIKQISTQHLLDVGKSLAKQWLEEDVDVRIPSIAKWLVCVYRSLPEYCTNAEELELLKSLPIIPLSKGQLVSLNESTVFFPLQKEKAKTHMTDPLRYIEQDLNTLHPNLLNCQDHIANSQIEKILEQCNVHKLTPHEVIHHHIMPVFKSDHWKNKTRELLCAYVVYIKHHITKQKSILSMEELRSVIRVDTNQGMKNPATEPVHFTTTYQNPIDLQKMLPGCNWVLLSGAYMPSKLSPQDISQWRDFFSKLGILDFLAIKPETVTLTLEELRESPWQGYERLLTDRTGPFTIEDYVCNELTALLTSSAQEKFIEMQALYLILDGCFDNEFERYTKTQLKTPGSMRPVDVETTFCLSLKQTAWVPVTVTEYTDGTIESSQVLMKGSEVYLKERKIVELLDNNVPYLSLKPAPKSSFVSFLQIHSQLNIDEILSFLNDWCKRSDDASKPKSFITTMDHVLNIYDFIRCNLPMQQIKDLFEQQPIIFLPKEDVPSHVPSDGEFWFRHEVCWEDPKGLFTHYRSELRECHCEVQCPQTLCHIYPGHLKNFFCNTDFGVVRLAPQWKEYLGLLTFVASYYPDSSAVLDDVLSIFEILGRELSVVAEHVVECMGAEIRRLIGKEKVFPTKAKSWASIEDKPMIVDKDQFFKWFNGKPGVHFLEMDDALEVQTKRKKGKRVGPVYNKDFIQVFLSVCRITTLSSCVSTELSTEMYNPCPDLQEFMWRTMPLLQLLLFNQHSDWYDTLVQREKVAAKLKVMRFASVGKLEVVYSIKHSNTVVHIQDETCAMDNWTTFYIHKEHIGKNLEIQKEIARVFSDENQEIRNAIRTFLIDVSQTMKDGSGETIDTICTLKEWEPIPETEQSWVVDRPVIVPKIPKMVLKPKEPEVKPADGAEEGKDKMKIEGPFLSQWPPPAPGSGRNRTGDSQPGGGLTTMWPPPKHTDDMVPFVRHASDDGSRDHNAREPGSGDHVPGAIYHRSDSIQSGGTQDGSDGSRTREGNTGDHVRGPGSGAPRRGERDEQPFGNNATSNRNPQDSCEDSHDQQRSDGLAEKASDEHDTRTAHENHEQNQKEPQTSDVEEVQRGSASDEPSPERQTGRIRTISAGANGVYGTPPRDPGYRGSHEGTPSRGFVKIGQDIDEEIIFDDLGDLTAAHLPHEIRLDSSEDAEEVGRIGEQLVYDFLKRKKTFNGLTIEEVVWINKVRESGDPFDIMLKLEDECGSLYEVYIEVKATKTEDKVSMGMSLRELDFASEKREQYYLYRVFNIGEHKKPKLVSINNVKEKLDRKLIRLCMICPAKIAQCGGFGTSALNDDGASVGHPLLPSVALVGEADEMEKDSQTRSPAESLLAAEPSTLLKVKEQKQAIGDFLYPLIHKSFGDQAGKITGVLLELDNSELLKMMQSEELLAAKVQEAYTLLLKAGKLN